MVTLHKTAPWNPELRNAYRDRFAFVAGRRFKVSANDLGKMWWVEEVEHDGQPTFSDHEIVSWCGWAFGLAEARAMIAKEVGA